MILARREISAAAFDSSEAKMMKPMKKMMMMEVETRARNGEER